jgi:hypothetical protein
MLIIWKLKFSITLEVAILTGILAKHKILFVEHLNI